MHVIDTIRSLGGLASRRQLALLGHGRHVVDRWVRADAIFPVRPGWVATPDANQLAILAVLAGARLTGPTALRSYGVWNGFDLRTHLQFRPNSSPTPQHPRTPLNKFAAPRFGTAEVVRHWAPFATTPPHAAAWRVNVTDAIIRFARTEADEQIVAAIESAVHTAQVSRSEVPGLLERLPRRLRRLGTRMTFLAESGLETVARLRLEAAGLRVDQQVKIGSDRVDFVVDGWLVIELDGDEWHDPVTDRIRTNRLIRAGYRVLRFGHREVFDRWDETLATILEMLLTPARQRTLVSASRNRGANEHTPHDLSSKAR